MAYRLVAYLDLLDDLRAVGFSFRPIRDWFENSKAPAPAQRIAYLRHDVDRLPGRAVAMAEAEAARGVQSTYYFRCDARMRFPENAMRRIASLGHETGFHYESLSRTKGNAATAAQLFERELAACRGIVPVQTVAPHGAPLASASNMAFSGTIDAGALGLLGDATDLDYTQMLYVTDTGGTFGSPYNLRDHITGRNLDHPIAPRRLAQRLIDGDERGIVLSSHPERWPIGRFELTGARVRDLAVNLVKMALRRTRRLS